MTPEERRKTIKYLNSRRESLRKKGADPANVSQYFGGNGAFVNFSKLSDSQLARFKDRVRSQPRVTVVQGSIYPVSYVSNRKYLDKTEGYQPLVKDYEKAIKSPLSTMTNKEYRKHRAKVEKEAKESYKKAIREAFGGLEEGTGRLDEILKFIDKLSRKDFAQFLDVVDTRLGFSAIKYAIIQKGLIKDIEGDLDTFDRQYHELNILYSLYKDFNA